MSKSRRDKPALHSNPFLPSVPVCLCASSLPPSLRHLRNLRFHLHH